MADVFISYKRDERGAVEQLAARLRELGLNVWFDAGLSAGESFNDEIDREARAARAILVCWSPTARDSKWVKAEAMIGFEADTLAAIHVAGPDGFSPPTPFNTVHAEDLRAWLASPRSPQSETHAGWKSVLRRIGKLCARADIESWGGLDAQASAAELRAWLAAHEASPLFMAVDAMLQAREAQDAERARLEQEARARRAKEEAERRAREEQERGKQEEREGQARALREVERLGEVDLAQRERERRKNRSGAWRAFAAVGALAAAAIGLASFVEQREEAEHRAWEPTVQAITERSHAPEASFMAVMVDDRDAYCELGRRWRDANLAMPLLLWSTAETGDLIGPADGRTVLVVVLHPANLPIVANDFTGFRTVEHLAVPAAGGVGRELEFAVGEGFSPVPRDEASDGRARAPTC
jgi:TIR domain